MDYKKVGILIKEKRIEKNLTQKELADMLYITDRAVSKWERGKSLPDISILKKLNEILDIDINQLLTIESNKSNHYKDKSKKIIYLIVIFIIMMLLMLFLIIKKDDFSDNYSCKKELNLMFSYNNRNVYYNCLSDVFVEKVELREKVIDTNFNLENFINNLDVFTVEEDGSIMYSFDNYKILSCNMVNGNSDIIIGNSKMDYEPNFCQNNKEMQEKCFRTEFFRIVDILDNYPTDDYDSVFITIDQFQDRNPINVKINKNLLGQLEKGKYYKFEFIYYIPNDYIVNNYIDLFNKYELVGISKTDKVGLELVGSNKCEKLAK